MVFLSWVKRVCFCLVFVDGSTRVALKKNNIFFHSISSGSATTAGWSFDDKIHYFQLRSQFLRNIYCSSIVDGNPDAPKTAKGKIHLSIIILKPKTTTWNTIGTDQFPFQEKKHQNKDKILFDSIMCGYKYGCAS